MALIDKTPYAAANMSTFGLFSTSEQQHQTRILQYMEYWKFYKGEHWTYSREDSGDPLVTVNYMAAIVNLHINFLMKNGFDIQVPDIEGTKEDEQAERQFIKIKLDEMWEQNKKLLWAFECGQMGAVTGDVWARLSWEDEDELYDPHVRVDILPSHYCFPEFGGPHGVDRKKVTKFTILFPRYVRDKKLMGTDRSRLEIQAEVWTADKVEYWTGNKLDKTEKNGLGEIPVIHIANFPIAGEEYGCSDMINLIDLQRELNEKSTDISDVINYHGSPITVIFGASTTQLQHGANRVWFLPEKPACDSKNLEISGDLSANLKYWNLIRQAIFEISSTPNNALGQFEPSSNAAAAAALAIHYLPMLDRRKIKEQLYGFGIMKINRMALKIYELKDSTFARKTKGLPKNNKYRTEIKFPEPFPRNEQLELEKASEEIRLLLTTRERALRKRLGAGEADAKRIVADAMEEQQKLLEMAFEVDTGPGFGKQNSGNPSPTRPNTDKQGEGVSQTASKKIGT